jgi:hypothetical protein
MVSRQGNITADALSHDNDRTDDKLTSILHCFAPHQMPNLFRIVPLPNEIVLWLILLLSKLPIKEQYREAHMITKLGRGEGGMNIVNQLDSWMYTSTNSCLTNESSSWELLPWLCVKNNFWEIMAPWLKAQSEVPSCMWFQPSVRMDRPTHQKPKIWSLGGFYFNYSDHLKTKTQK